MSALSGLLNAGKNSLVEKLTKIGLKNGIIFNDLKHKGIKTRKKFFNLDQLKN